MGLDDVEKLIRDEQKKRGSGAAMQRWFLKEIKKLPYAEMDEVAREWMPKELDADERMLIWKDNIGTGGREIATTVPDLKNTDGR